MIPYTYVRASSVEHAVDEVTESSGMDSPAGQNAMFYAGGTTMLDLMKLGVLTPSRIVDITKVEDKTMRGISFENDRLSLGALVTMHEAAYHEKLRELAPVLSDSLLLAASQQLRHMATLGGNVLQRTRCPYFRDPSWPRCNKRNPGSGCDMIEGINRLAAVLGTSEDCIAMYPGDWAQALIAFDADVDIIGPGGLRRLPFGKLHRKPGDTPHVETALQQGEIIARFHIPLTSALERSLYVKARDRESYAFANASAAVGLELDGDRVTDVRIGIGGVATVPWRAHEAEDALRGKVLDEKSARAAAQAAFADARTFEHNAFKTTLGPNLIVQALLTLQRQEA